ncbi:hypothetical protein [Archangium sp.]|uniref:hypothetical protein n=1 Tax=Archangium sp. TaxID=1872627 RepID=UPI00286D14CC|nr:hypothetical protein [Archangium sp.]
MRWLLPALLVGGALAFVGCRRGANPQGPGTTVSDGGLLPDSGMGPASASAPEDASRARLVRLNELIPTPPSPVPTTAMLRSRSMPASGRREQVGDIIVTTQCGPRYCTDGLRDTRSGLDLIPTALTAEEHELVAASAEFERAVRIAHLGDSYLSAYRGATEFSGGAHANNELACGTWDRRTGRQLRLSELVPPAEARALHQRAAVALQEFLEETGRPRYMLDEASFLYDSARQRVTFCALAPMVVAGTVIEIPVERDGVP